MIGLGWDTNKYDGGMDFDLDAVAFCCGEDGKVANSDTKEELIKYDLGEEFSIETTIVIAQLYRNGSEWKFNAIGSGFEGGLGALCKNFGLEVQ